MSHNVAAERLLLSCFIRHTDTFFEAYSFLTEDDFTSPSCKSIFQCISSLFIDKKTTNLSKLKIIAEAKSLGIDNFMSLTKDGAILDEILAQKVEPAEFGKLFIDVKKCSIIRNYDGAADSIKAYLADTSDNPDTIIQEVESRILKQSNTIDNGRHAIVSLNKRAKKIIEEYADNPGSLGLDIGLPIWQHRSGQIRNGAISFMAASAKMGKSQFALRAGKIVAHKHKVPVLIIDTELNEKNQAIRFVGMFAGVPYNILETGFWKLTEDELHKEGVPEDQIPAIVDYGKRLRDPDLWEKIDNSSIDYLPAAGLGMEQIIPKMRQWVLSRVKPSKDAKAPQCLIIYDYIKLSSLDEIKGGKVAEWQMHGLNVAALHDFANHYNVPVFALGQTNKEIDDNFNCIAGGKRIVENVDSISLLKVKTEEERMLDSNGDHLIRVFAGRFGPGTPNGHININFRKDCGHLEELEYKIINFFQEKQKRLQEYKKQRDQKDDDDDQ